MYYLDEYSYCDFDFQIKVNKKKKIKFNNMLKVKLIPNIKDFEELYDDLWWNQDELQEFRQSSTKEILGLISRHKYMSIQQASKLLYQPGNMTIKYDPLNFEQ